MVWDIGMEKDAYGQDPRSMETRMNIKIGVHQTDKLLPSKGNNQHSTEKHYR
jgi:hypothetical protein